MRVKPVFIRFWRALKSAFTPKSLANLFAWYKVSEYEKLFTKLNIFKFGADNFEDTSTVYWNPYGSNTAEITTEEAHSGTHSLKITCVDNVNGAFSYIDGVPTNPSSSVNQNLTLGKIYRLSLWVKATNAAARVNCGITGNTQFKTLSTANVWTRIEFYGINARTAAVSGINFSALTPGDIVYVDDLKIEEYGLGIPVLQNQQFEDWTSDNPDWWTVQETPPNGEVSEVGSGEANGGSGTGSCNIYSTGATNAYIEQEALIVGQWYTAVLYCSYFSGSGYLTLCNGTDVYIDNINSTGIYSVTFKATTNAKLRIAKCAAALPINATFDFCICRRNSGLNGYILDHLNQGRSLGDLIGGQHLVEADENKAPSYNSQLAQLEFDGIDEGLLYTGTFLDNENYVSMFGKGNFADAGSRILNTSNLVLQATGANIRLTQVSNVDNGALADNQVIIGITENLLGYVGNNLNTLSSGAISGDPGADFAVAKNIAGSAFSELELNEIVIYNVSHRSTKDQIINYLLGG